jgi:hypothetical protein
MKKRKIVLYGWWQAFGSMDWYPNDEGEEKLRFIPLPTRLKKDLLQICGFGYGAKKVKITIKEI